MSEIGRTGKRNLGGGRWLEVMALRPAQSWCRIYTTPGTLGLRETPQRTDNGPLYAYELQGFSPDDNPDKGHALDAFLTGERVLVRFCDNQGLRRLIGTPIENLTFNFEYQTDTDVPGQRGYRLTVSGLMTKRAPYNV